MKGLAVKSGSRTFIWRLLLGVIPDTKEPAQWVEAIRKERAAYYKKTEGLKIVKN